MKIHKERNITHIFFFLVFASALGWFINSYPPESLWQFGGFYLLFGLSLFFLLFFIINQLRHVTLITIGSIIFLMLRVVGLRDWYYAVLLILIFISLDIVLRKNH